MGLIDAERGGKVGPIKEKPCREQARNGQQKSREPRHQAAATPGWHGDFRSEATRTQKPAVVLHHAFATEKAPAARASAHRFAKVVAQAALADKIGHGVEGMSALKMVCGAR
jgi:hypothetical protein